MNDAFNHPQSVIVLGGTSDIAGALVDRLVAARCRIVILGGRDPDALARAAKRAKNNGADTAKTAVFNALEIENVEAAVAECFEAVGDTVDLVLITIGRLGEAAADVTVASRIAETIMVNFTWPAAALVALLNFSEGKAMAIVVFSSVAGVRIREANFIYGSAKSGLDGYALGLAETLRGSGVHLHVVRPGFVRTKMTEGLPSAPLAVDPEVVATAVMRGIECNQPVIWVPSTLRWVFVALRHLPRQLWRRLPG